jgi:uncharacterized membrane protein
MTPGWRTDRFDPATRRVTVSAVGGALAAATALAVGAKWSVAALCASDLAELAFILQVWLAVGGADADRTAQLAGSEDESPIAAEVMLVGAGVASLIAVVFALAEAGHAEAPARGLLTALAVASVLLAWAAVHTVYALRYARLYYSDPVGGVDFGGERPDYVDFAYLALTIGMTFQVSDTSLTLKRFRHAALRHALLSYLYGAFIVAITVSSVATLLGR